MAAIPALCLTGCSVMFAQRFYNNSGENLTIQMKWRGHDRKNLLLDRREITMAVPPAAGHIYSPSPVDSVYLREPGSVALQGV